MTDGRAVLVPMDINGPLQFATGPVPGDIVELEEELLKNGQSQAQILQASPYRQEKFCPNFPRCGACAVQELQYERLLQCKAEHLAHLLGRHYSGVIEILPAKAWHYRRKAFWHFEQSFGYLARGSNDLLPVSSCPILHESLETALAVLNKSSAKFAEWPELRGLHIRANYRGEVAFLLVLEEQVKKRGIYLARAEDLARAGELFHLVQSLLQAAGLVVCLSGINYRRGGRRRFSGENLGPLTVLLWSKRLGDPSQGLLPMDEELLASLSEEILEEEVNGRKFLILPGAFFQVNPQSFAESCRRIGQAFAEVDECLELFSGTGALAMAALPSSVAITALELSELSLATAKLNAKRNKFSNYEAVQYDLRRPAQQLSQSRNLIVDPPRSGLSKELVEAIRAAGLEQLVYLSCHPAKLARDLKLLGLEAGRVKIRELVAYDYFPWTMDYEALAVLEF